MFEISLSTWEKICLAYQKLGDGVKKASLQWFPFTKISTYEWDYLASKEFYELYINNGSFILSENALYQSENYIQKSDGSFRDAVLVSPLLYLVLQSVGYEIAKEYKSMRPDDFSVHYAGSYDDEMTVRYKLEYDNFFKEINSYQDKYNYYIKTDITNFFQNINLDKLINQMDNVCNKDCVTISQTRLQLYKRLLEYSGEGRFPLIENSIISSFLATVVYLDKVDCDLYDFLESKISSINEFKMIRYVDDLYILIATNVDIDEMKKVYNEVRNEYSSIIKEWGLALNSSKCKLGLTIDINQDLKKSLYDEFYNGEKCHIEELYPGSLGGFLEELLHMLEEECIDIDQYNCLIEKQFNFEDIEFTPTEVYNYFVYESESEVDSYSVTNTIKEIIQKNIMVLSLDPKRLGILVMKTRDDRAIKATLNELFKKYRSEKWNSYDTTIAIAYLLQSGFRHIDLLSVLKRKSPKLHKYYYNNCKTSFVKTFKNNMARDRRILCKVIDKDWKAYYLYFMYYTEMAKNNNLTAYAYFKNYFDRVTTDLDYVNKKYGGEKIKKPNYRGFYRESTFKNFYACIDGSRKVIEKAHELRNGNPVSHSRANIIDNDSTADEIHQSIDNLKSIIRRYIISEGINKKIDEK